MGELEEQKADRLSEKIAEKRLGLDKNELERFEGDSHTGHTYYTDSYFIKIERYFNQRERMIREPVILNNIDIEASTPEVVDYGHINGYNYRVFDFIEGKPLSIEQEKGFQELERNEQVERIRQIGKALAEVHESKSFEGYGNIETLNGYIIGTSSNSWSKGLKDIQYFWHEYVGGQPFEELKEEIETYYENKSHVLNEVEESVLMHQEFGFHNLLFQEDGLTVVDWESAGAGDPLLDVITAEVILFWLEGLKESLRKEFRKAYLSVRDMEFDENLVQVYRVVELSRLLIVFKNDEEKVDKIKNEITEIISD